MANFQLELFLLVENFKCISCAFERFILRNLLSVQYVFANVVPAKVFNVAFFLIDHGQPTRRIATIKKTHPLVLP